MFLGFEGGFPMFAIEGHWIDRCKVNIVYAAHIDVDHVGIRSRYVERMNAADAAKRMLGHVSVEGVSRQMLAAAEYFELVGGHDHVQQAFHCAHRAIADGDPRKVASRAKTYRTAMTPALVGLNHERPRFLRIHRS